MDHVMLGHDTSQHVRESGLEGDSMGDLLTHLHETAVSAVLLENSEW